jgi:type IV pilus assembly protein PilX
MRITSFHLDPSNPAARQRGVSLIVVLIVLVIATLLGIGSAQIALMAERSARNDRDAQIAWQAAEAALLDAELDIHDPKTGSRHALLGTLSNTNDFVDGCGNSTDNAQRVGLCALPASGNKPAWITVDFTQDGSKAQTVEYGQFTGRQFAAGSTGIQPSRAPRYVIEALVDPGNRDLTTVSHLYRVTAMGFGPNPDVQVVTQIIYRD